MITQAIEALVKAGYTVERDAYLPGLYWINSGPELTINQVIDFARQKGLI